MVKTQPNGPAKGCTGTVEPCSADGTMVGWNSHGKREISTRMKANEIDGTTSGPPLCSVVHNTRGSVALKCVSRVVCRRPFAETERCIRRSEVERKHQKAASAALGRSIRQGHLEEVPAVK